MRSLSTRAVAVLPSQCICLRTHNRLHPRWSSTLTSSPPAVFIAQKAAVFPFGVPSSDPSHALFPSLDWTIASTEAWAILSPPSSSTTKTSLVSVLRAQVRFDPPSSATWPILSTLAKRKRRDGPPEERLLEDVVQLVSFGNRRRGGGGAFDDYTARYYAIRDEDKLTVRQHLRNGIDFQEDAMEEVIERTAKSLEIDELLDLPLVTLSNGQTRRARIVRALLAKPELLILEEPFTGLDVASRALLVTLLAKLHASQSPRILLALRPQDELPAFVSHIALIGTSPSSTVTFGSRDTILSTPEAKTLIAAGTKEREMLEEKRAKRRGKKADGEAEAWVRLKGVNVTYGDRQVLKEIDWTIRGGERWLLAGHNGSGKSTLLAVILGDHPRSFTEDVEMFGKPRDQQATATLQADIGHVSPEIFNAFPRKYGSAGLTVQEAILTGFESIYTYRKPTSFQLLHLDTLLTSLSHPSLPPSSPTLQEPFASISPSLQSLTLLLRALVKRPKLLVLDECFAFMDSETVGVVKRFLDEGLGKEQAVVVVSHFEEEVPACVDRTLKLESGRVVDD